MGLTHRPTGQIDRWRVTYTYMCVLLSRETLVLKMPSQTGCPFLHKPEQPHLERSLSNHVSRDRVYKKAQSIHRHDDMYTSRCMHEPRPTFLLGCLLTLTVLTHPSINTLWVVFVYSSCCCGNIPSTYTIPTYIHFGI